MSIILDKIGTILKMNNVYKNVQSVQTQKTPITQPNKNENACFYLPIILLYYTLFSLVFPVSINIFILDKIPLIYYDKILFTILNKIFIKYCKLSQKFLL